MARLFAAWELGSNLGHLGLLSGVADEFVERGHEVYLLSQKLANAHTFVDPKRVHFLQTPMAGGQRPAGNFETYTFADLLKMFGFLSANELVNTVRAWRELFELAKPDLVVLNSAAVGFLACHKQRFKTVTLGSGYGVPPLVEPLPPLFADMQAPEQLRREREKPVLETVNRALQMLDQEPLEQLWQLFDVDEHFVVPFRELDHYPDRKGARYTGLLSQGEYGEVPRWPKREGTRIFAYLRAESRHFEGAIQALRAGPGNTLACVPDLPKARLGSLQSPSLTISLAPFRMSEVTEQAELAIFHAGTTTIAQFLVAGVPSLLLPNHLEQSIVGSLAARLGAARLVRRPSEPRVYQSELALLMTNKKFTETAKGFAAHYQKSCSKAPDVDLADELEALLGR
jgi:UDP:flavonoid glycosyltransferase YjiC (YdhE family)